MATLLDFDPETRPTISETDPAYLYFPATSPTEQSTKRKLYDTAMTPWLSLSLETIPIMLDRNSKSPGFATAICNRFLRIFTSLPAGFCSSHHHLPLPVNHCHRESCFTVDQPWDHSRLWELDPVPSPHVGGHCWHHWTQLHWLNSGHRW